MSRDKNPAGDKRLQRRNASFFKFDSNGNLVPTLIRPIEDARNTENAAGKSSATKGP